MTCPSECDPDCSVDCHEWHQGPERREHDPIACATAEVAADPDRAGVVNLNDFIDKIAEVRYLTYDSHASMPGGFTWEQYKAEDPDIARALYLDDVRREVGRATPLLGVAFRRAGWSPS